MGTAAASVALLSVTVVTAVCAEYLVASIEETAVRYSISNAFIGIILLPIAGNAADHVTAIWMAMKNKYELTITICVGSSIGWKVELYGRSHVHHPVHGHRHRILGDLKYHQLL
jgi:Ca2+:H+ antiporter